MRRRFNYVQRSAIPSSTFKTSTTFKLQTIHYFAESDTITFYVESSYLPCFRDDEIALMYICTRERHANCLKYNFTKTYECRVLYVRENGVTCYQDRPCPS